MPGFGLWLAWFSSWWNGAEKFYDVPQNAWYFQAMKTAKRDQLHYGYPDGLFTSIAKIDTSVRYCS